MTTQTILIVEDEQVVASDLEEILHNMGYRAIYAHSGHAALSYVQQFHPDLILIDVQLGGQLDGIDTAAHLCALHDVPVVFLSTSADPQTRQRAAATKPYGYLIKPCDQQTLQITIEMALARHSSDRKLREREQWFATTLASIDDAVVTTDTEARITFLNTMAAQLLHTEPAAVIGRSIDEVVRIVHGITRKPLPHPVRTALATKHAVHFDDIVLIACDGTEIWIGDSAAPITLTPDTALGAVMIFRDISARHQAEAERLEHQQRMEAIKHLERLRVLSGGVAHDLNNMLAGLMGYAELALMEPGDTAMVTDALNQITIITRRAADLTQQLLAYAGRTRLNTYPLDLNHQIEEVIANLRHTLLRDLTINLQLSEQHPFINGDAGQIRQIVLNLLVNAAEAIETTGGSITVSTEIEIISTTQHSVLSEIELPPGTYAVLTVADTGVGIDEATRSRIFEPFFSTKFTGRGLGLAAVWGNVHAHGGTVLVDSTPGQGTIFTVLLPIAASLPEVPPAPQRSDWRGQGVILIIDDDAAVRTITQRLLEHLGFTVLSASDGYAGIALFQQTHQPIECVLIDLTMPGLSGTEVVQRLRVLNPTIPVVLMSGYSQDDGNHALADAAQMRFLAKPFTLNDLRAQLQQVFNSMGRSYAVG